MPEQTSKSKSGVFILACSGPSGVGQLANRAAVELTQAGLGQMLNLAGIAAHRNTFVQSAQELAHKMVVMDGCSVGCAKGVLDHLHIPVETYLVLTDLGIEKSEELDPRKEDIEKVKSAFKEILPRLQAGLPAAAPKCLCAEEW